MELKELAFEETLQFENSSGAADNYFDLMRSKSTLEGYRFFGLKKAYQIVGIAGVSSDNVLSVYSDQQEVGEELLQKILKQIASPSLILGNSFLDSLLEERYTIKEYRPYFYMSSSTNRVGNFLPEELQLRRANSLDKDLINKWYEEFNREHESSWDAPDLRSVPSPNLYLAFWRDEFCGACANTLRASGREWVGYLFVKPAFRGRAVGAALMAALEKDAFNNGKSVALLVDTSNSTAVDFYQKRSYKVVSTNGYWNIDKGRF